MSKKLASEQSEKNCDLQHVEQEIINENKRIMKITDGMRKDLRRPFPPEALKPVTSKTYLTSIKAQYVVERLNDVFGVGRWFLDHEIIKEQNDQVLISGTLIIKDFDVVISKQYGSHKLVGKGVELADGYKSAITDCLTKSASHLEIGIDIFKGINDVSPTYPKPDDDTQKKWLDDKTYKAILKCKTKKMVSDAITKYSFQVIDNIKYCAKKEMIAGMKTYLETFK